MCLIFLGLNAHPDYKLIVAANRDEFYNRKTAPADYWTEHPDILGGRDLEAMGTWLAMTRAGKISMLTNYRDLKTLKSSAPSRGQLVSDFLVNKVDPSEYLHSVREESDRYNGFNLIVGDANRLWYYSNYGNGIQELKDGTYGLSNHLLDTPWPKVVKGKVRFNALLSSPRIDPDDLFDLLYDEEMAPDDSLPATGLSPERERALSSIFIKTPDYGSRCSTVILVNRKNEVMFCERAFDFGTFEHNTQTFKFALAG